MSIDRLYYAVEKFGPFCVGLDVDIDHLPKELDSLSSIREKIFTFNRNIIDATKDLVACYKPQLAYYESYGIEGMLALRDTLSYIRNENKLIINDIKRSDIDSTAKKYAKAYFSGDFEGDIVTLNPYMGLDSILPFMEFVKNNDKGIFVIIKTSNKGSKDFEMQRINDSYLYEIIADKINELEENVLGKSGYRKIGFVIGATNSDNSIKDSIREKYKENFFLIPGYGAQGGSADDAKKLLNGFNGGVINSSRGIIRAFEKIDAKYYDASRKALIKMREEFGYGL